MNCLNHMIIVPLKRNNWVSVCVPRAGPAKPKWDWLKNSAKLSKAQIFPFANLNRSPKQFAQDNPQAQRTTLWSINAWSITASCAIDNVSVLFLLCIFTMALRATGKDRFPTLIPSTIGRRTLTMRPPAPLSHKLNARTISW